VYSESKKPEECGYYAVFIKRKKSSEKVGEVYDIKYYGCKSPANDSVNGANLIPFSREIKLVKPVEDFDIFFAAHDPSRIGKWDEDSYKLVFQTYPEELAKIEGAKRMVDIGEDENSAGSSQLTRDDEQPASDSVDSCPPTEDKMEIDAPEGNDEPDNPPVAPPAAGGATSESSEETPPLKVILSEQGAAPSPTSESFQLKSEELPEKDSPVNLSSSVSESKMSQPNKNIRTRREEKEEDTDPFMKTRMGVVHCEEGKFAVYILKKKIKRKKRLWYKVLYFAADDYPPDYVEADSLKPFSPRIKLQKTLHNLDDLYARFGASDMIGKWTMASYKRLFDQHYEDHEVDSETDEFSFEAAEKQTGTTTKRPASKKIRRKLTRKAKSTAQEITPEVPIDDPYLQTRIGMTHCEGEGIYAVYIRKRSDKNSEVRYSVSFFGWARSFKRLVSIDEIFPFTPNLPMEHPVESFEEFFEWALGKEPTEKWTQESYDKIFAAHPEELKKRRVALEEMAENTSADLPSMNEEDMMELDETEAETKVALKKKPEPDILHDVSQSTANLQNKSANQTDAEKSNSVGDPTQRNLSKRTPVSNKRKRDEKEECGFSPVGSFMEKLSTCVQQRVRKRRRKSAPSAQPLRI